MIAHNLTRGMAAAVRPLRSRLPLAFASRSMCVETSRNIDLTRGTYQFDTHEVVTGLRGNGFTDQQSEALMSVLVHITNSLTDHQTRTMLTKAQQEISIQQVMSHIAAVKKDMIILEKSEFSALRNENEKLQIELSVLRGHMKDEFLKMRGNISLDISLERSRAVEAHAVNEKDLSQLSNRIDTGIANLKTMFEQYRNDVFKYAGGTILSCVGIMLGFYRLWN